MESGSASALPSCASIVCRPLTLVHLALAGLVLLGGRRRHEVVWRRVDAVVVAATLTAYMASIDELPDSCPSSRRVITHVFRMAVYAACHAEPDKGAHKACRDKVILFYMAWVPMLTASALGAMLWWRSLVMSWRAQSGPAPKAAEGEDDDGPPVPAPAPAHASAHASARASARAPNQVGAARQGRPGSVSYTSAHNNIAYHGPVTQRNVYNEGRDHGDLPGSRFATLEQWAPTYDDDDHQ
jgi:hypothetical protein